MEAGWSPGGPASAHSDTVVGARHSGSSCPSAKGGPHPDTRRAYPQLVSPRACCPCVVLGGGLSSIPYDLWSVLPICLCSARPSSTHRPVQVSVEEQGVWKAWPALERAVCVSGPGCPWEHSHCRSPLPCARPCARSSGTDSQPNAGDRHANQGPCFTYRVTRGATGSWTVLCPALSMQWTEYWEGFLEEAGPKLIT